MPEAAGFIINPSSNAGKAPQYWYSIRSVLDSRNIIVEEYFTRGREDYENLIYKLYRNGIYRIFIAGGDGSFSEAANVIMKFPEEIRNVISLGLIPLGSGNDRARTFGINPRVESVIDLILMGRKLNQDVGKIEFILDGSERYFTNMAGIGFDANTAYKANEIKSRGKGSKLNYAKALGIEFFKSGLFDIEMISDENTRREKIFSLATGIGQYNGNGIKQCPYADPFDGEIDVTLIKRISRFDFICNIPRLGSGNFIKHKQIETFRTRNIIIKSDKEMLIEADGEICGRLPVKITILPEALPVIIP